MICVLNRYMVVYRKINMYNKEYLQALILMFQKSLKKAYLKKKKNILISFQYSNLSTKNK